MSALLLMERDFGGDVSRGFIIRVYVWWIAFSGFLLFVFSGSSSGSCLMVRGFLLFVYVPGSFLTAVRRFFLAGDSSESPGCHSGSSSSFFMFVRRRFRAFGGFFTFGLFLGRLFVVSALRFRFFFTWAFFSKTGAPCKRLAHSWIYFFIVSSGRTLLCALSQCRFTFNFQMYFVLPLHIVHCTILFGGCFFAFAFTVSTH